MSIALEYGSLVRGERKLLDNVSFCLESGEVVAIAGANGAGKTSLLRLLSGELPASSGRVMFDGEPLAAISLESRARSVAVLPQHSSLDFPFIAREVILMGRIPHFTGDVVNQAIASELVERMQLTALASRPYTTLSGGERQRVQIARVLCQVWDCLDDAYILLDEPTAPLDLAHQLGVLELLHELSRRGAGIMLVIHDINLASRFCDRMTLMQSGRVIAEGLPVDVVTPAHISAAFGVAVDVTRTADGAPLIYTKATVSASG